MKYISIINIIFRILFTSMIFFLIKDIHDYIYVPPLISLGYLTGGIFSIIFVYRKFPISFISPSIKSIQSEIRDSFGVFISSISSQGTRYFSTILIGVSFGEYNLGLYSMVEKLYFAIMAIPGLVSQTIFPYMSRTKNLFFIKKIIYLSIFMSFVFLFPMIYYRDLLLFLVYNINEEILSNFFIIIFLGSFFSSVNILIGYPLLGAFGFMSYANKSMIYSSIIYMVYIYISCFIFANIYLAISSIFIFQIILLFFRIYYLKESKILNEA